MADSGPHHWLAVIGFLLVGREGALNGLYIGLAFGAMFGVITAGSRVLAGLD